MNACDSVTCGSSLAPPIEREAGQYSCTRTWILHGDISELGDAGSESGKSYLFFLTATIALESVQPERELYSGESTSRFEVSGALLTVLENPREGFIRTPGRTHNRLRSPRLEASSQVEQCRQGKSAKQIRNFGKRIGSKG
eukprot:TRINITY_DN222_c0_g2_i1.p2 TRINITY_DN222_c0_g2~~TRINITY_DN222_c0_g2_i1.p2  ORF type:complete len:141 (+),score=9.94 TRINITY_DN222_c0_g2_i1:356-778(+)